MFLIESSAERRLEIRGGVAMGSVRIAGRLLVRNATIDSPADAPRFSTRGRPGTVGAAIDASGLSAGNTSSEQRAPRLVRPKNSGRGRMVTYGPQ